MDSEPQPAFPGNGSTSGWFRRTPKVGLLFFVDSRILDAFPDVLSQACANCRRDKIRCDGVRPCSNCSRRGFYESCVNGCDPCRHARVRCEEGKPCQRCRSMHIECTEETSMNSFEQYTTSTSLKDSRIPEKTKLACISCRKDNKKCDDRVPCSRCASRSEECVRVARAPKLIKLRCEGCRRDNKRCEDNRPCKSCIDSSETCTTLPRRGKGHGTRVKSACISCRRDKVRCDGIRPCSACTRKGSECIETANVTRYKEGKSSDCTHRKQSDRTAAPAIFQPDEHPVELYPAPYGFELSSSMTTLTYSRMSTSDVRSTGSASYQQVCHSHTQHMLYPNPVTSHCVTHTSNHSYLSPALTTADIHHPSPSMSSVL
ncbi:hypothetical protein BDQ17DRAFT_1408101 [Cyathus striatus]|nr:hypothetical protein BDQ17DRAFT_1408101 [Cyathus striatus]